MQKIIFGITGPAGSGKTTLANILSDLIQNKNLKTEEYAFATLLKEQAKYHGWNGVKDQKGRTLLQELGDTLRHYHGDNYFAHYLAKQIEDDTDVDVAIVHDMRYLTELDALKGTAAKNGWKFVSIRICRDIDNGMTPAQKAHSSENDLNEIATDYAICNDGSMATLVMIAQRILNDVIPGGVSDAE